MFGRLAVLRRKQLNLEALPPLTLSSVTIGWDRLEE